MIKRLIPILGLLATVPVSCTRDPGDGESVSTFAVSADDAWGITDTKSLLSDGSVESNVSCMSIGLYCEGNLRTAAHYASASGKLKLENRDDYTVYALVNMGDMSHAFPENESEVGEISYRLQSYDQGPGSINAAGIPMAGSAHFTSGGTEEVEIPVKRLLAKVTANMKADWPGGKIRRAFVGNMNGVLKPFGRSVLTRPEDVFTLSVESGTPESPSASASLILYVPENLQGEISGIGSSEEKSPDANLEVMNKGSLLTFLQVEVEGDGLYSGLMTYRNFLGNNATGNFDIERNCSYIWDINYSEDKLSRAEWKYDSSALEDLRSISVESPVLFFPGMTITLSDYVSANIPINTIGWSARIMQTPDKDDPIETVLNPSDISGPSFETVSMIHAEDLRNIIVGIYPLSNPTAKLRKEIKMYAAEQYIFWKNTRSGKYYIYPGRTADTEANYVASYYEDDDDWPVTVYFKGKGGRDWFWTDSPASGISSQYLGDTGKEYELIRYSADPATLPGECELVLSTYDGYRDKATLHICDTRFIKWTDRSNAVPSSGNNFSSYKFMSENKIAVTLPPGSQYASARGLTFTQFNTPFSFIAGDRSADIKSLNPRLSGYPFEGKSLLNSNWSDRIGINYSSSMGTYGMYGDNSMSGYLNLIPAVNTTLTNSGQYTVRIFAKNGYNDATRHTIEARIICAQSGTYYELVLIPAISKVQLGSTITLKPVLYVIEIQGPNEVSYRRTELSPTSSYLTWNGAPGGVFTATEPGNYRVSCSYLGGRSIGYADIEVSSSDIDIYGDWDGGGSEILD